MAKRVKKPLVEPGKRREWFRRHEEGESVQQIAKSVDYDVRTVRKQIDLERQERERKEARSLVLRKALEDHYADLCAFAQKLDSQLSNDRNTLPMLKGNRMWSALREHLPRSVIWKSFDSWGKLLSEKAQLEQKLNEIVGHQIESRAKQNFAKSYQDIGLSRKMIEAVSAHIRDAALGQSENVKNFDFHKISENEEADAVKLVKEMLDEASTWKELDDLRRLWTELERVRRVLSDELAVIILRRVIPGRCRYCPI